MDLNLARKGPDAQRPPGKRGVTTQARRQDFLDAATEGRERTHHHHGVHHQEQSLVGRDRTRPPVEELPRAKAAPKDTG